MELPEMSSPHIRNAMRLVASWEGDEAKLLLKEMADELSLRDGMRRALSEREGNPPWKTTPMKSTPN